MSGIKGLQGVVRKTVNDELQANIWEPQHMDKIVPSLLFNLQQAGNPQRWERREGMPGMPGMGVEWEGIPTGIGVWE